MDPRPSFETTVLAAFAAAVLVVTALAATTWKVASDAAEAAFRVSHAHEVLDALAKARGDTHLIESSTLRYMIYGDAGRLDERDVAISARETWLHRIKELTADDARQQERWTRLREAADERLAMSGRATLLRATEGFDAARAYTASAPVRQTRERLFKVFREMEEEERRLLKERGAEQARTRRLTVATGAITALALVVLLSATYVLIRRQMRATEASRRALAVANARLAAILDTIADGILTIDERGIVQTVNPAAERMFGHAAAEVIGRNVKMLMPEPYHGEHDGYLERYRATGQARVIGIGREAVGRRKDGSTFPLDLGVGEMRVGDKRQFVGSIRDITERKRSEEQLRAHGAELAHKNVEIEQANRAKSEFLSRMSHELRTPLNSILGFAQLLDFELETPEQRDGVTHILRAGRHLLVLIDEVLDIARIEAGRMSVSLEPVSLGEVLRVAVDLVRPQAAARRVAMPDVNAGNVHVVADRQRLQQVLLNLLSNAIKYNREGGWVRFSWDRAGAEGRLQVRVADSGPGIASELMARLFTPFDRLGAEQTGIEGTGLGLALSKHLVEAMGGTLSAESTPGEGTMFIVELQTAQAPDLLPEPVSADSHAPSPSRAQGTILYIEDNLANLTLFERLVGRRPGLVLLSAMQGRRGLELARDHRPDVIVLDLHLPDIPGTEVLARLRADANTEAIPVVILSADATAGQIARLQAQGVRAYVTKPLDVTAMLRLLDEIVARRAE